MYAIPVNGNQYKAHGELVDCATIFEERIDCHVRRCSFNEASGTVLPTRVINCGYNRVIYSDSFDRRMLMASNVDLDTLVSQ